MCNPWTAVYQSCDMIRPARLRPRADAALEKISLRNVLVRLGDGAMRTEGVSALVAGLAGFYSALFVLPGIQMPFFPVWLEAKGVNTGMIGIVLAAPIVARLLGVPAVMREADRRDAVRAALIICGFAAAAGYVLVGISAGAVL